MFLWRRKGEEEGIFAFSVDVLGESALSMRGSVGVVGHGSQDFTVETQTTELGQLIFTGLFRL